eukprot:1197015-Rhodomonas_salina.6
MGGVEGDGSAVWAIGDSRGSRSALTAREILNGTERSDIDTVSVCERENVRRGSGGEGDSRTEIEERSKRACEQASERAKEAGRQGGRQTAKQIGLSRAAACLQCYHYYQPSTPSSAGIPVVTVASGHPGQIR